MWREMGRDRNLISNPPAGWGATRGLHSDRARSDNLCNRLCGLELCPSANVRMWTGFLSTLLLWWLGRRQAAAETIVDPGFCAEGTGYKVRTCKVSFPGLSSTCCASAEFSLAWWLQLPSYIYKGLATDLSALEVTVAGVTLGNSTVGRIFRHSNFNIHWYATTHRQQQHADLSSRAIPASRELCPGSEAVCAVLLLQEPLSG